MLTRAVLGASSTGTQPIAKLIIPEDLRYYWDEYPKLRSGLEGTDPGVNIRERWGGFTYQVDRAEEAIDKFFEEMFRKPIAPIGLKEAFTRYKEEKEQLGIALEAKLNSDLGMTREQVRQENYCS